MKKRTCILIKPDGIEKKVVGKILAKLEESGFTLMGLKLIVPEKSLYEKFYAEHQGKPFYDGLMNFMLSGPLVATVWQAEEGIDIIARSRQIIGATNSVEAAPGTLRQMYGTDNRRNVVHGSDSDAAADREIKILFKSEELRSEQLPSEELRVV